MSTKGLLLAALLGFTGLAHAVLPPAISGAWYNPAQSGHGISLEILDQQRAIAFWYVYDANGHPIHLYIDGHIEGHAVSGTAYLSRGMRFGEFDPARHTLGVWGRVTLAFGDCTHATLSYDANGPSGGPSFGAGTIPMTRLTQLAGLDCQLSDPGRLPHGLYSANYRWHISSPIEPGVAAVDPDGVLWATRVRGTHGPSAVTSQWPPAVVIGQVSVTGDRDVLEADVLPNDAFYNEHEDGDHLAVPLQGNAGTVPAREPWFAGVSFDADTGANARIRRELRLADLVGRAWTTRLQMQFAFNWHEARVEVDDAGAVCLKIAVIDASTAPCAFRGAIKPVFPGWTFFSFELRREGDALGTPYSGRGWVEYGDAQAERLVFVGDNDRGNGFGLVLTP